MEQTRHVQGSQYEQRGHVVPASKGGGGEANEMNAIIKVEVQAERGKPQREAGRRAVSHCYCIIRPHPTRILTVSLLIAGT